MGEAAAEVAPVRSKNMGSAKSFKLRSNPSLNSVRLRRIFDMFDSNGDGIITADELSQALNLLGLEADIKGFESTVNSYASPEGKGLEFQNFAALHNSLDNMLFESEGQNSEENNNAEESDLREAFNVFDKDGDGYISAMELQTVLGKLGFPESREIESVRQMIVAVDVNHDGLVDFLEFKEMMRSVLVPTTNNGSQIVK